MALFKFVKKNKYQLFFSILASVFAAYHFTEITIDYLKYETISTNEFVLETKITPTQYHTCLRFSMFDGYLEAKTDIDYLALGPSAKELLMSCDTYLTKEEFMSDCLQTLSVKKFLKYGKVCYSIKNKFYETDVELLDSTSEHVMFMMVSTLNLFAWNRSNTSLTSMLLTLIKIYMVRGIHPKALSSRKSLKITVILMVE